ncbi:right-handed parallel beta-helix repeat-containing protein [Methanobrevibacter curvatus]|nr:right-handed parallel beta-helix repeat-containing protein [Methanobrevibacter curvatus]
MSSVIAVDVQDSSYYNISNESLNQQIQKIIDSSNSGDTVKFLGKNYENITLIINKNLNILSSSNTKILNNGLTKPIFQLNSKSSGTVISGFNLINNKDNAIYINGVKNLTIKNNNIASKNLAIYIYNSSNIQISNNDLVNSNIGLGILNSNSINIKNNNIKQNKNHGIYLKDSINTIINHNIIENNIQTGIEHENSISTQIINNTINKNENGIITTKSAKNLIILYNTISSNNDYGIKLDSNENTNLKIKTNTILRNYKGISFTYHYVDTNKKDISFNRVVYNTDFNILVRESNYNRISVGANWFGANEQSKSGVCPKLNGELIQYNLIPYKNQYGNIVPGLFIGVFTYGNNQIASNLPDMTVAAVFDNHGSYLNQQYANMVDGIAIFNFTDNTNLDQYNLKSYADVEFLELNKNANIKLPNDFYGNGGSGNGNGGSGNGENGNGGGDGNTGNGDGSSDNSGDNNPGENLGNDLKPKNQLSSSSLPSGTSSSKGNTEKQKDSSQGKILNVLDDDFESIIKDNPYFLAIVSIVLIGVLAIGFLYKRKREE